MSQVIDIIDFIRENGSITTKQATELLGCYRLSARIGDMRAAGIPVDREMVTVPAHNGENTRVARYTIPGGVANCLRAIEYEKHNSR